MLELYQPSTRITRAQGNSRVRRIPPARKPLPNAPIPKIPTSNIGSQPSSSASSPFQHIASLPPPPQPPFSPAAFPDLKIHSATPNTPARRRSSDIDAVFSYPALPRPFPTRLHEMVPVPPLPTKLASGETPLSSDIEYEDEVLRPYSSPVHSTIRW